MSTSTAQENGALTAQLYELFAKNDYDGIVAHVADDAEVLLVPFGQTFYGREGFRQFLLGFKTAFPDCTATITNQVTAGDQVVNEIAVRGTHTGPLMSPAGPIPATGRGLDSRACEVWRFRDGQVVSLHNYQDAATMLRQLGLMP